MPGKPGLSRRGFDGSSRREECISLWFNSATGWQLPRMQCACCTGSSTEEQRMLNTYPLPSVAGQTESVLGEEMASPVVWFDLLNARDQETAAVERVTGLHVPTLAEISEIEST